MYEAFPIVLGALIGLLVPRFVTGSNKWGVMAVLGVIVAAAATVIAGEEWFFIFIDLAEVFLAMGVTVKAVEYFENRNKMRIQ